MKSIKKHRTVVLLVILLLFGASACSDAADTSEQPSEGEAAVNCPRLELALEEFDDCVYEGYLRLHDSDSLDAFCSSTCKQAEVVGLKNEYAPSAAGLSDLSVLRGLRKVESLTIERVDNLMKLHGLEQLEVVEKHIYLEYNPELESLEALSALERVGGVLNITDADNIRDLDGLESLREIRAVSFDRNDGLENIEALENLETLSGSMVIENNPNLPTCQAERLQELLSVPDDETRITGNGSGSCE